MNGDALIPPFVAKPPPKAGRSRNPTRWLVGYDGEYKEILAIGAKAAVTEYVASYDSAGKNKPYKVWPLRPGSGPLVFDAVVETVTQITITEAT